MVLDPKHWFKVKLNKKLMQGAVAISFSLQSSSLCFLCSHFAAGQSQIAERNNDYSEAVKKVAFPNVSIVYFMSVCASHLSLSFINNQFC